MRWRELSASLFLIGEASDLAMDGLVRRVFERISTAIPLFLVSCRYPFLKLPIGVPYTWHSSHESANSFPPGGLLACRTGFPAFL